MAIKNNRIFWMAVLTTLILNKSGMMMIDEPSLHLVEKAKKKIENRPYQR